MFLRFLLVGGSGFLIDAGLTLALIWAGAAPWLARLPAIALAMLFTWLANRAFTYQVGHARTVGEALRYAATAAVMALCNYLCFLLLMAQGLAPLPALVLATLLQTVVSFFAYRRLVFGAGRK